MGNIPRLKEKFQSERRELLRKNKMQEYIMCVFNNDLAMTRELDLNRNKLCIQLKLNKERVQRSQNKYVYTSESHKLLERDKVLSSKIPDWLTLEKAKMIEKEMQ
mmetsp:Transcript_48320/g.35510  ORF Transcript_48320/g.35510 Transcript_48320/m.35510 type:complete len:105 (+) Transcript_48320:184-498(+)